MPTKSSIHPAKRMIVLYDGDCILCNFWVSLIKRNKHADRFQCESLQSWLQKVNPAVPPENSSDPEFKYQGLKPWSFASDSLLRHSELPDSVIVIRDNQVLMESDAVLTVIKNLKGPIQWLRIGYVLPKGIRNGLYRWVARNRYRWFGKINRC